MDSVIWVADDTTVRQDLPGTNYGQLVYLVAREDGTHDRRTLIFFTRPFRVGATVISAKLRLTIQRVLANGAATLSVKRISGTWREDTVNWTNQPATAGSAATLAVGASVPTGTVLEVDVTTIMQDVAAGNAYNGLQVTFPDAIGLLFDSGEGSDATTHPQLEVVWTSAPSAPTDMKPAGGRAVSLVKPTFTWKFNDLDGDQQSAFRVEVANDSAFTSMVEDSGWVSTNAQQYTLFTASLTAGNTYYWRVTTKDSSGVTSPVSDVQQFTRTAKSALSITSPGATTEDTTPPVVHTFGGTQTAMQTLLYEQLAGETAFTLIYDSGYIASAATSFTIPDDLITSETATYRVARRVWDDVDREATPGDPIYVEDTQDFTYVNSGAPAAPTSLTLTPDGTPSFLLTWQIASVPDYFALVIDGKIVNARIDPASVFVSGTTYQMRYWETTPNVSHTFEIQAVVNSAGVLQHSGPNPTVTGASTPADAWLAMPSKGLYVRIATPQPVSYEIGEDGATFFPVNRRDPVRIVSAIRGNEGSITGAISVSPTGDGEANRKQLEDIKSWHRRGEPVILIHGNRAFRVLLGKVSIVPETQVDNKWFNVSVEFWQTASFGIRDR